MVERLSRQIIAEQAIIHEAPALRLPHTVDRNFELPAGLFVAMAGLFFAAVGVMAFGFAAPAMIIPTAIIVVFIAMFFGTAAMWMKMKPEHSQRLTPWSRFRQQGIMTAYGRSTAWGATVQVLILPVLILFWGIAVVTIAAVVG
jgi:hypothetical protein